MSDELFVCVKRPLRDNPCFIANFPDGENVLGMAEDGDGIKVRTNRGCYLFDANGDLKEQKAAFA